MITTDNVRTNTKTPDPIGMLLINALVDQIQTFLDTPVDKRADACRDLFNITPYPAGLSGDAEGADPANYDIYLMQRSVRMDRNDPTKHRRLSCDVVAVDRTTHIPMYMGKAYITPTDIAAVEVYCANKKDGIEYYRTLKWSNVPSSNEGEKKA